MSATSDKLSGNHGSEEEESKTSECLSLIGEASRMVNSGDMSVSDSTAKMGRWHR
uniref:Uncharacterized protein n=1 Tax=Arundo donax TaxID=35708 RepID=A0A0A8XQB7_ARUDO